MRISDWSSDVCSSDLERENLNASRSYDPTAVSPDLLAITKQTLEEGYRLTSRFAATLNVDFKATDNLTLSLRSRYNRNSIWQDKSILTYTTGAGSRAGDGAPALNFTAQRRPTTDSFRNQKTIHYKLNNTGRPRRREKTRQKVEI